MRCYVFAEEKMRVLEIIKAIDQELYAMGFFIVAILAVILIVHLIKIKILEKRLAGHEFKTEITLAISLGISAVVIIPFLFWDFTVIGYIMNTLAAWALSGFSTKIFDSLIKIKDKLIEKFTS